MLIHPRHRWLYPIDWQELSATIRFKRAKARREHCGRPHGKTVRHLGDGRWWDEDRQGWRCGKGRLIRKVLPPTAEDPRRTTRAPCGRTSGP